MILFSSTLGQRATLAALAAVALAITSFAYRDHVQPLFEYTGMAFDSRVEAANFWPAMLAVATAASLFSPRLSPAQIFAFVVLIFVYNSILVVAPHAISEGAFRTIAIVLFLSFMIIAIGSNVTLPLQQTGNARMFAILLYSSLAVQAAILVKLALERGVSMPSFSEIYALREELEIQAAGKYALMLFNYATGCLALTYALRRRKPLLFLVTIALYVLSYSLTFQKTQIIAPVFICTLYILLSIPNMRKPSIVLTFYMAPMLATLAFVAMTDAEAIELKGYVLNRMYLLPGQIFANYVDFFSYNPHTQFSHISVVNWFIPNPYDTAIPLVIREYYPGGNQNANFWTQDAIAGAGLVAVPFVSIIFAAILVVVNSSSRGLDVGFSIPAYAMTAQRFADGTIPTTLFSGGLGLLILLMLLVPRDQVALVRT